LSNITFFWKDLLEERGNPCGGQKSFQRGRKEKKRPIFSEQGEEGDGGVVRGKGLRQGRRKGNHRGRERGGGREERRHRKG